MKINSDELRSALKMCPENVECQVDIQDSGKVLNIRFTDKGGRDVKVSIYDVSVNLFPTITFTERLPR
jgi:hypothetical protein